MSELSHMKHTSEQEKYPARCEECGCIFVVSESEAGDYAMGAVDCPDCGSSEFEELEYTGEEY